MLLSRENHVIINLNASEQFNILFNFPLVLKSSFLCGGWEEGILDYNILGCVKTYLLNTKCVTPGPGL